MDLEIVKGMVDEGASVRMIAERLKLSRIGVVSFMRKHGLEEASAELENDQIESGGIPFSDVETGQCRRPLWSSKETIGNVCGHPTLPGKTYCPECSKRLYMTPEEAALAWRGAIAGIKVAAKWK